MTNYSKLRTSIRVAALSGLANRMVDFYEKKDLTAYSDYAQFVAKLKELALQFNTALNQEKALSELADLDVVRDNSYRALYQMVQAYTYVPSAAVTQAANKVFDVFDRYGLSIVSLAYDEETGMLDSLLNELASEELTSEIEKLTFVPDMLRELKTAESNFKQASNRYEQNKASQKAESPSASKLKSPLLKVINDHIVSYHTALAEFKDAEFQSMANTLNGMIENENSLTRSRVGKKEEE